MILLSAAAFAIIVAGIALRRRLPQRALFALGAILVLAGIAAIGVLEWRYASANTHPLDARFDLAHAGRTVLPAFTAGLSGPYDIWLETDRAVGIPAFGCLTGEPEFEALCPGRTPALDVDWTAFEDGAAVARGGSDIEGWRRRQAALDPAAAARRRAKFNAYQAKADDPSNNFPLFHRLGTFAAVAGKSYALALTLRAPVSQLSALHPRITVGLSEDATHGLGASVIGFGLLCVLGGGLILLFARARVQKAVP